MRDPYSLVKKLDIVLSPSALNVAYLFKSSIWPASLRAMLAYHHGADAHMEREGETMAFAFCKLDFQSCDTALLQRPYCRTIFYIMAEVPRSLPLYRLKQFLSFGFLFSLSLP